MTAVARFRKLPVVIDAVLFDGTWQSGRPILDWIVGEQSPYASDGAWWDDSDGGRLTIPTREGRMVASAGDWIIRGVQGEFYPCKPGIFAATYEAVPDDD